MDIATKRSPPVTPVMTGTIAGALTGDDHKRHTKASSRGNEMTHPPLIFHKVQWVVYDPDETTEKGLAANWIPYTKRSAALEVLERQPHLRCVQRTYYYQDVKVTEETLRREEQAQRTQGPD